MERKGREPASVPDKDARVLASHSISSGVKNGDDNVCLDYVTD